MSIGRPITKATITEEQYRINQARIQQAQAAVNQFSAMNEEAKRNLDMQNALLRKIEEGKEAERLLQSMMNRSTSERLPALTPGTGQQTTASMSYDQGHQQTIPPAARIVEVPNHHSEPHRGTYNTQTQWGHGTTTNTQVLNHPRQHLNYPTSNNTRATQQWQQGSQQIRQTQAPLSRSSFSQQGQAISVTQRRQALPMQSVMQPPHAVHPTPQRPLQPMAIGQQSTTSIQPPSQATTMKQITQTRDTNFPSTSSGTTPASMFSTTGYTSSNALLQPYRPTNTSGSSSLAGALDIRLVTGNSSSTPSQSASLPVTGEKPTVTPLGTAVANLQQQLASNVSTPPLSVTPALTTTTPDATIPTTMTSRNAEASGSNTTTLSNTLGSYSDNQSALARLHQLIAQWQLTAPANTYYTLPGSGIKVYKDLNQNVHFVIQDKEGKHSYIPLSRLAGAKVIPRTVCQDADGNFQFLPEPLTAEQKKKYRPYSIPPHPSDGQAIHSLSWMTKPNISALPSNLPEKNPTSNLSHKLSASNISAGLSTPNLQPQDPASNPPTTPHEFQAASVRPSRSPAQADKRTLAKDILRALKQPRSEDKPQQLTEKPTAANFRTRETDPLELQANHETLLSSSQSTSGQVIIDVTVDSLDTRANDDIPPRESNPDQSASNTSNVFYHPSSSLPATSNISHYSALIQQPTNAVISYYRTPKANDAAPSPPITPITEPTTTKATSDHAPASAPEPPPSAPAPAPSPTTSTGTLQTLTNIPSHGDPPLSSSSKLPVITPVISESEANKRKRTPLFLPSPSASPRMGGLDSPMGRIHSTKKSQPFYILVPSPPDYVRKYKAQQLRKKRLRVTDAYNAEVEGMSSSKLWEDKANIKDVDINPTSNGFGNDDAEREAVLLSCSRLSERPCKWNGCGVIMNSAETLLKHFFLEHRQHIKSKNLLVCIWKQCGQRKANAIELYHHLRSHAIIPLLCAYDSCQESFRTPRQLAKHHTSEHSNDSLKPAASFFRPNLQPPPAILDTVPAYMIEPVQRPSISKNRHTTLGPWVLRNIAGPVNLATRRYNLADKPSKSLGGGEGRPNNQPYDFLSFPSAVFSTTPSQPSKIRDMDDLDSGEVSELVNDGMLWDVQGTKKEGGDDTDLFDLSMTGSEHGQISEDRSDQVGASTSDEEAVESMLAVS